MKVQVDRRDGLTAAADVTASGVLERPEKDDTFPRSLQREDDATKGLLKAAWARKEVKGKRKALKGEVTVFHRPDGKGRLLLVGLGPRAKLTPDIVRRAAAEVVRACRGRAVRTVGFNLGSFVSEGVRSEAAVASITDGVILGNYEFEKYRSTSEGKVEEVTIYLGEEFARDEAALKKVVSNQAALDDVVIWTREIANLPADTASPQRLAEEAVALGKEVGLKVTVFDEKKLSEMGCGGILAVGGGSAGHPPRMIVLEYPGGARRGRTVAVVGKGITFDSGGISIKPALGMQEMKFDKSGAVAVLGILRAAATLKVPPRVIGV
ncbi:MAG TPA: M17 family peptidase N-terminal domain-containing protein, partial [Thermoplasmata archaeon]|nr:M17 family peptidase N-terminal domain-containing protein [Thermoplasmata archaeon]